MSSKYAIFLALALLATAQSAIINTRVGPSPTAEIGAVPAYIDSDGDSSVDFRHLEPEHIKGDHLFINGEYFGNETSHEDLQKLINMARRSFDDGRLVYDDQLDQASDHSNDESDGQVDDGNEGDDEDEDEEEDDDYDDDEESQVSPALQRRGKPRDAVSVLQDTLLNDPIARKKAKGYNKAAQKMRDQQDIRNMRQRNKAFAAKVAKAQKEHDTKFLAGVVRYIAKVRLAKIRYLCGGTAANGMCCNKLLKMGISMCENYSPMTAFPSHLDTK